MLLQSVLLASKRFFATQVHTQPLAMMADKVLKAIVTHEKDDNRIALQFSYTFGSKARSFNLSRTTDESLSSVLSRIGMNILKHKDKNKKKRKNIAEEISETILSVKMFKSVSTMSEDINSKFNATNLLEVDGEVSCLEAFVCEGANNLLQIEKQYYTLDINPPTVVKASLPDSIMTGYLLYPNILDIKFSTVDDCLFTWFVSDNVFDNFKQAKARLHAIKWNEIHQGFLVEVANDMKQHLLKVVIEPREGERSGLQQEVVAKALVSSGPLDCPYTHRHQHTQAHLPQDSVRVVSYNLLADTYASTSYSAEHLFPTCPAFALNMDYRKQLLLQEIIGYHADVLCLQEVDESVFHYDLCPVLSRQSPSFSGCYASKLSDSTKEGPAIFYNKQKFRLLESHKHGIAEELSKNTELSDVWQKVQSNRQLMERVTARNSVLQVCVLERLGPSTKTHESNGASNNTSNGASNNTSDGASAESFIIANVECASEVNLSGKQLLVVANSHFYYHPNADHIRILQSIICCSLLQQLVHRIQKQGGVTSVLLCGDLNSTPDTGVYELATTGRVTDTHPGWRSASGEEVEGVSSSHTLGLASACGTPDYTNYAVTFNGCLDWIFYQTQAFKLHQVVELPSHEQVTAHTALPSITIPSDHLALVADLKFRDS